MNVKEVVPFLRVVSMEKSLRFYVDGVGFTMKNRWVVDEKIRWCWLSLGGASLMLQDYLESQIPADKLGVVVSVCFTCEDALVIYREVSARGLAASEPFVGNGMWVTSVSDPDGYRVEFQSVTDMPEETKLSEVKG
jgi:uncharacterized glyoxalase superfamily protein PhnB